jgi:nitrite reductase (NADH) large subunit
VGLDVIKKKILDDAEGRKALWEQLQFALDGEPDPWFEFDKARVDVRQFDPVAVLPALAAPAVLVPMQEVTA